MKYDEIVTRLREAREAAGLSLAQVARSQGASRQLVSNREHGRSRADLDQLREWAEAVGLDMAVSLAQPEDAAAVRNLLLVLERGAPETRRALIRYVRLTAEELAEEAGGTSKAAG